MVVVFVAFFCGFDSSILQGFYIGLVQNMRFRCRNLVKTHWKKPFNCCQFCSTFLYMPSCSWVPLGCSMNSFFSIPSSVLNLMAHYPMGTTSGNHADLLQYLLTSFISTGQHPFICDDSLSSLQLYLLNVFAVCTC
jgi:hypothetical protein